MIQEKRVEKLIDNIKNQSFNGYFDYLTSYLIKGIESPERRYLEIDEQIKLFILLISNIGILNTKPLDLNNLSKELINLMNNNYNLLMDALFQDAKTYDYCKKLLSDNENTTFIQNMDKNEFNNDILQKLKPCNSLFSLSRGSSEFYSKQNKSNNKDLISQISFHSNKFFSNNSKEIYINFAPALLILNLYLTTTRSYFNNKRSKRKFLFYTWESFNKKICSSKLSNLNNIFLFQLQFSYITDFYKGGLQRKPFELKWKEFTQFDKIKIIEKNLYCLNNASSKWNTTPTKEMEKEINQYNTIYHIIRLIDNNKEMKDEVKLSNLLFFNHYSNLIDFTIYNESSCFALKNIVGLCTKYVFSQPPSIPSFIENGMIYSKGVSISNLFNSDQLNKIIDILNKSIYFYSNYDQKTDHEISHPFYEKLKTFLIGNFNNMNTNHSEIHTGFSVVRYIDYIRDLAFSLFSLSSCVKHRKLCSSTQIFSKRKIPIISYITKLAIISNRLENYKGHQEIIAVQDNI